MIRANIHDGHFEEVGGIFRTQSESTLDESGQALRSVISLSGRTSREWCGASTDPTTGDPFQLGVDTDIIITGAIDRFTGYGETTLPSIPAKCSINSTSPVYVVPNGGLLRSPREINAPRLQYTLGPAGGGSASVTFSIKSDAAFVNADFAIKTEIILANGAYGYREDVHTGRPSTTTVSTPIVNATTTAVAVSFGSGGSDDILTVTLDNQGSLSVPCEVKVVNLSGAAIITQSNV
ncbi:hypothetical protein [Brucella endophytica]|nr:hypothetical protein [Brucella endophytica]